MSSIAACAVSLPQYRFETEAIQQAAAGWLHADKDRLNLFLRLMSSSNVKSRGFVLTLDQILELGGLRERSQLFEKWAPRLALPSIEAALKQAGLDSSEIDTFIFTSCSVPAIPSVDALLIKEAGMSPYVRRIPIFQHGCAGGVVGLELAHEFASAGRKVLLTSVELCSLLFHFTDVRSGQLVGGALFSDGAASLVIKPEGGSIEILASSSCLLPNSRHLMGYELLDDGLHLLLDRELPLALAEHIPRLVAEFLTRHGLTGEEIPWWLFHPGGPKILTSLQRCLGLKDQQCRFAEEILVEHGNMSSATIMFVLNRFLTEKVSRLGDLVLLCGVGPGLTVELILCRMSE